MSDKYASRDWYVDINRVRTDYPRIENLQQYINDLPPQLHPEHPIYIDYWSKAIKKAIEGQWGHMFGKYRYMPGNLWYFGNYGVIEHSWEENGVKVTEDIKPMIVDYLWEFAYQSWTAYGFSGFEKDEEYSCSRKLKQFLDGELEEKYLTDNCFNSKGDPKQYINAWTYLNQLHDFNKGKALFENQTLDILIGGSRGGSKSYYTAIAEGEYNFIFGGARRYDQKFLDKEYKSSQCFGSSEVDKSAELLNKLEYSLNAKANAENKKFKEWFGIWTELDSDGKEIVTPPPIYKRSLGNLKPGNKKNIFRAKYKVEINGEWHEKGDGSSIAHVNYSSKKGAGGDRAAEGGRYLFSDVEECGSAENLVGIKGANDGTVTRGGIRFGVQMFQGTSGNIEYVQAMKKFMENPDSYNILSYQNVFSKDPIAYFLPYYITLFPFKDKDGNTDYQAAIDEVNRQRATEESDDPKTIRDFQMNKPCYLEEMWLQDKSYYFPYSELLLRERQLTQSNHYLELEKCVDLIWDSTKPNGVDYKILHPGSKDYKEPYRHFPHTKENLKNPEGCVVIYEFPKEINGQIPPDLYKFIGHDPHGDGKDPGSSVASTYILMNPKYAGSPWNLNGNTIVASYNGKPKGGLDEYYKTQEKLLSFYGNPPNALMYERNKGMACRAHYVSNNKIHLLAREPQFGEGKSDKVKLTTDFGYYTGASNFGKSNMATYMSDWCLEWTELVDGKKQNWERIPCLYLIRQMMQYDTDGNFDAVDGFRGCILGLREEQIKMKSQLKSKTKQSSNFRSFLNNSRIFQQ